MAYAWHSAGYDGGGRSNAGAIDPNAGGNCAIAGDVWGPRNTVNGGDLWEPKLQGQKSIGGVYGRAVEFSVKNPGRSYWGIGTLTGGGGYFGQQDPSDRQLVRLNSTFPFGSSITVASPGSFWPRAVGNRIVVDYDSGTGTEYVYGQAANGIFRAVDTGSGPAGFTAFSGTTPLQGAGKSMALAPDGSLYAIDWGNRSSNTTVSGQTMWHITNPRGTPTVSTIAGPSNAGPWNELRTISGVLWCVCALGLFKLVGGSWVAATGSGLVSSGSVLSSIGGVGQTLYCGLGQHPAGSGHTCAKSTNGGASWTYVTTTATVSNIVQGTSRPWWLMVFDTSRGLLNDHTGVNELRVDPNNPNFVLLAGESGAWATKDGGASWQPCVNGLMGSEVSNIAVGTTGEAWNNDTDWGTIHTLNHYSTVAEISGSNTAHSYTTASLVRTIVSTVDGLSHTYAVTWTGSFYDITKDGTSIADTFFKGAVTNPTDLAVDPDETIYVAQFGGGVTVGNPRTVIVVAPTSGVPTLDASNPLVGTAVHVLVNDSTWNGTHPLTYTYQWQEE